MYLYNISVCEVSTLNLSIMLLMGFWVGDCPNLQDDAKLLFKILVSFYSVTGDI